MNTLQFATGGMTYLFRYAPGCEAHVVGELMRLADDEDHELDWLDAATLGFQVVRGARGRAPEKAATKGPA